MSADANAPLPSMTAAERQELGKLVRLRAKVAKSDVAQYAAKQLSQVETELAAEYSRLHPAWAQITAEAEAAVSKADALIAQRCTELGIRAEFKLGLWVHWNGRGKNGDKERRAELRRVAQSRIDANVKQAHAEIDRCAAQQLTQLASGAICSDEARAFLASMPSIDALMPPIMLASLDASLAKP